MRTHNEARTRSPEQWASKHAKQRAWYLANKEKHRAAVKRHNAKPETKAKKRAYYEANKELRAQQGKAWRARNPDCRKGEHRRWKERTPNHREIKRDGFLRKKYGISLKDYEAMVASQKGGCSVCGGPAPKGRPFSVDHDHATGAVRGLLCQKCNTLVGYLEKTNADVLYSAKLYITAHKALALVA